MPETTWKYDVALSFAGEQRSYVKAVAGRLHDAGVRVFFDEYETADLWGKNLYDHLDEVYSQQSRYCVLFASEAYKRKVWTDHERQSAQERAIKEKGEYILPVRFDDTKIPGLRDTIGYQDANKLTPLQLARLIVQKLGPRKSEPGMPLKPDALLEALTFEPKKRKAQRNAVVDIALEYYEALERTTTDERRAVAAILLHGCGGEHPEYTHISLDKLSRLTDMSSDKLLTVLAKIRSLNFHVVAGNPAEIHESDDGTLIPEDQDIRLSFWTASDRFQRANEVIFAATRGATAGHCSDCSMETILGLDFHRLSKAHKEGFDLPCDDEGDEGDEGDEVASAAPSGLGDLKD